MTKSVEKYTKALELVGVEYSVKKDENNLIFQLGRSHTDIWKIPQEISVEVKDIKVILTGTNKQYVHQLAANIRSLRQPEPYKGKGIRYLGEVINLKKKKK